MLLYRGIEHIHLAHAAFELVMCDILLEKLFFIQKSSTDFSFDRIAKTLLRHHQEITKKFTVTLAYDDSIWNSR